jgi:beta-glucanase (GH16 family)
VVAEYRFGSTPIWREEFNYTATPDSRRWGYDIGAGGWGNNEAQFYTNSNAFVVGGHLVLSARRENRGGAAYTSSRLVTKNKASFLYGRFEARIKLPAGRGTWPAFWMLPSDNAYGNWPNSGEIDIMEHVGYDPNVVHITTHCLSAYAGAGITATKTIPTALTDYHLYRIDWTPTYIKGYIDNLLVYTNEKPANSTWVNWPYNRRFHLLLNVAVGGNWGGAQGIDDNIFPVSMLVDYVRVYELDPKLRDHEKDKL